MDDPNSFLEKYEAQVTLSNKRYARRQPMRFSDWNVRSVEYDYVQVETEQYLEVTIPKHRLQELVERDRYFNEMVKRHDYAQHLLAERTIEDTLRRENPSVEKAYQKYKMLLEIARR